MVQWTLTSKGPTSIPRRGTKILHAARCGQKKPTQSFSTYFHCCSYPWFLAIESVSNMVEKYAKWACSFCTCLMGMFLGLVILLNGREQLIHQWFFFFLISVKPFLKKIYLFTYLYLFWLRRVLVAAHGIFVAACGLL